MVLNSSFRTNQKDGSTSFIYEFPETLKNVINMKLSAIEVPVDVYFTVSQHYKNNKFTLTYDSSTVDIIVQDGNYPNCNALVEEINRKIEEKMLFTKNLIFH